MKIAAEVNMEETPWEIEQESRREEKRYVCGGEQRRFIL